jgi:hypothetical protein
MGRARKKTKMRTVNTEGTPITQNELIPLANASSNETRVEVAPSHDAARERNTRKAGKLREARKKSSKLRILLENRKLTPKIRTKYPLRNKTKIIGIRTYNRNQITIANRKKGVRIKLIRSYILSIESSKGWTERHWKI